MLFASSVTPGLSAIPRIECTQAEVSSKGSFQTSHPLPPDAVNCALNAFCHAPDDLLDLQPIFIGFQQDPSVYR